MNAPVRLSNPAAEAQVFVWRFGWAWPLAVAAAALAITVHFAALAPARSELVAASTALAQAALRGQAVKQEIPPATERQQLLALQATLRPAEAAELIRRLGELARAEQITLAQGEYQQQLHPETQLLQLRVTQPVKAGYPQLKRYIESVLRTIPNASLDQITARRENVGQAQLEVRLRWSFWSHVPKDLPRDGGGRP